MSNAIQNQSATIIQGFYGDDEFVFPFRNQRKHSKNYNEYHKRTKAKKSKTDFVKLHHDMRVVLIDNKQYKKPNKTTDVD